MMHHKNFSKGGMVSVWIGNFSSDTELDNYMNVNRQFEQDFGFMLNERDMPETTVEPEPVPIRKLLHGFSWSDAYAQSVAELATKQGVERATTMLVFLNFEYQPERARPQADTPLKFLGAVRLA